MIIHAHPLLNWIEERTGLHVTRSNQENIFFALQTLAERHGITTERYVSLLLQNQLDPEAFLHLITVHESYFLRSKTQMDYVVQTLIPAFSVRHPGEVFRVLSIACAQGEEPYSLAMLCQEAGWDASRVSIHAFDLSRECITMARTGLFTRHALRGVEEPFLKRHFVAHGEERFTIHPRIRSLVQFEVLHFPRESVGRLTPGFQVIFCQNLLFYMIKSEVANALREMRRLLTPQGWLFLDGASSCFARGMFTHVQKGNIHGFQIAPPKSSATIAPDVVFKSAFVPELDGMPQPGTPPEDRLLQEANRLYRLKEFRQADERLDQLIVDFPRQLAQGLLGKARILADEGSDMEAMELAEQALQAHEQGDSLLSREEQAAGCAIIAMALHNKGLKQASSLWFERLRRLDARHPALSLEGGRA